MKGQLFWKSVIRRRVSLLLLLALTAAASFGFMLRAVEYLAVDQEIERISEKYNPIGTLYAEDWEVTEGVPLVQGSPYVEFVDINRYCPAILSDIYNADLNSGMSYFYDGLGNIDVMVWAEVDAILESSTEEAKCYRVKVREGVYGYPEYIETGRGLVLEVPGSVPLMEEGKTYLVQGRPKTTGGILRYESNLQVCLRPLEEGLWFLEGSPDEETALGYIDDYARVQERNRHAMVLFSTKNMCLYPLVQESSRDYYLEEGRWLTSQDQEEGNMVCVVKKEFADKRGLFVGDTLTMTVQDREVEFYGYTLDWESDTWETDEKTEISLEIVGVYDRFYGGQLDTLGFIEYDDDSCLIFVPDSCIPEGYCQRDKAFQDMFSFMLADPRDKEAFLQEVEEELDTLGITVSFVEDNWDSFYPSAQALEESGLYSLLVFVAVLVAAQVAVSFLYTWQRKKEVAIAIALGVPAGKAASCSCLPMLALSGLGILAGGGLAWGYGLAQAEKSLSSLVEGASAGLSPAWFAGISFLVWLLLALMLLVGSFAHARRPVLSILQGGARSRRKAGKSGVSRKAQGTAHGESVPEGKEPAIRLDPGTGEPVMESNPRVKEPAEEFGKERSKASQGPSARQVESIHQMESAPTRIPAASVFRFVARHLRAFSLRTVSALLAAAVFSTASCWLWYSIVAGEEEIERLFCSVALEAHIVKEDNNMFVTGHGGAYISGRTIKKFLDTGFVSEWFLLGGAEGEVSLRDGGESESMAILGIADLGQYLSLSDDNKPLFTYGDGYGEELFGKEYDRTDTVPVILPEYLWEKWGLQAGDEVLVENSRNSVIFKVAAEGFYSGGNTRALMVPMSFLELMDGDKLYYSMARFVLDPEKNRELEEFRQESQEIMEAPGAGLQELSFKIWDEELEQVMEPMEKNIALMELLYPLSNGVAFLAAAGLSVLFLFQRRREAAVLRVLGVGVRHARGALALELLMIDLAGLLLGVGLTALLAGVDGLSAMPTAAGCYFLGCLVGTMAGAVLVTRGRPLELLQEKE